MRPDQNLIELRSRSAITYIWYASFFVLGMTVEYATNDLLSFPNNPRENARLLEDNILAAMALFVPFTFPMCYSLATIGRSLLTRASEVNNRTGYRVVRVGLFLIRCSIFGYLGAILAGLLLDWRSILMPLNGVLASSAIVFAFSEYAPGINQEIALRTPRTLLVSLILLLIAVGNAAAWGTSVTISFVPAPVASYIQLFTVLSCVTIISVLFSARLAAGPTYSRG